MKSYAYPAIIKKSRDGTYDVQFANFKEGFTYGNTLEEARDNACDVLSLLLESYLAFKKALGTVQWSNRADLDPDVMYASLTGRSVQLAA